MLSAPEWAPECVGAAHRAKLAYVYVRQSTAMQVRQHQESTELQYRLVDRAAGLGWPRERIAVIDDDLGKSGASASERSGFQRLIAEIGLGKAGLVLSLVNVVLKPLIIILSLPAILLTLGLFTLLVNGFTVWIAAHLVPGLQISFWAAVLAGMIVSLINYILTNLLEVNGPRKRVS